MPITVKSRTHRTLRHLQRFKPGGDLANLGVAEPIAKASGSGELLGVYSDESTEASANCNSIAVFENGLLVIERESIFFVPYKSLVEATVFPTTKKMIADKIRLELDDGTHLYLTISGGAGRSRDVYEFDRFLLRVIRDNNTLK
jgi:hypothetical protein